METKKRILSLLLASALLAAPLTACDTTDDEIDSTEETTEETTSKVVEGTTEQSPNNESTPSKDIDTSNNEYQIKLGDQFVSVDFEPLCENPLVTCDVDDQISYTFVFKSGHYVELGAIFKTMDGGDTWIQQPFENAPSFPHREFVRCIKMLTENIGIISARPSYGDDTVRAYITSDGGQTWSKLYLNFFAKAGTPIETYELLQSLEIVDMEYSDGIYVLYVRGRIRLENGNGIYRYLKYSSPNLKTWTFLKSYEAQG
ncbi:MAG: hypothetical protein IJW50_09390 [Clostridia bacterium]|nr:hypothetical protein [Clostridia bacterium]